MAQSLSYFSTFQHLLQEIEEKRKKSFVVRSNFVPLQHQRTKIEELRVKNKSDNSEVKIKVLSDFPSMGRKTP